MGDQDNFWKGWHDRLAALRNVPPVLKIVWESGPGVVMFGLVSRVLAALLPVGLIWVTACIIDIIKTTVTTRQVVAQSFVVACRDGVWARHWQQHLLEPHDRLFRFSPRRQIHPSCQHSGHEACCRVGSDGLRECRTTMIAWSGPGFRQLIVWE